MLIKATGGGGGMGIYKCFAAAEVKASFPLAVSQGKKSFGNGDVFIEKYIESAKHIEVQVRCVSGGFPLLALTAPAPQLGLPTA